MDDKNVNLLHLINGLLTFSYAVLYSTLALFLSECLGYSKAEANSYVGIFLAYNFALHLIAGYLGDHYFSNRSLLLVSALFQIIGTSILSFSSETWLLLGLSFIILGCGINTTSLKCILMQRFKSDSKREKVFFINYAVVNAGFLLGFFSAGYFDIGANYANLFHLCNVFNVIAILCIMSQWNHYKEVEVSFTSQVFLKLMVTFAALFFCVYLGFKYFSIANILVVVLCLLSICYLLFHMQLTKIRQERMDIFVFLILVISSIVFWTLFYIGPMRLTYFLKNNVSDYFGMAIPPQWYMNLNSLFVIMGSPILASIFHKLRAKGYSISIVKLFSYAIILIAISYFVLSVGILAANELGYVSAVWIILHFLLQAIGELFIAPVGYAMVGQFAPQKLQGIMMGLWMMISGIAASFAQYLSNLGYSESTQPLLSNSAYLETFNNLVLYAVLLGLLLISFSKKIEKLIKVG